MTDYVHGYGTREQERLVEQAEHWRHRLITNGTALEPGTRLLEVGCGVGAVLAVLGQEFPGIILHGVDIEPKQLAFARGHLERAGVEATLVEADARALPFADQSFDHVWMMPIAAHPLTTTAHADACGLGRRRQRPSLDHDPLSAAACRAS